MGDWNLTIQGIGCHHNNGKDFDADVMAREFVHQLKKAGHTIHHAALTYGGKEQLLPLPGATHEPKDGTEKVP